VNTVQAGQPPDRLAVDPRLGHTDIRSVGVRALLRANRSIWRRLPRRIRGTRGGLAYGRWLQRVVRAHSARSQNPMTYFFRDELELEVAADLVDRLPRGADLRVAVIACSMGAEPYSLVWTITQRRPDLRIDARAVDLEPEVIAIAREGGPWDRRHFQLESLTPEQIAALFDQEGSQLRVKRWLRDAVTFEVADGTDPATIERLGPRHLVLANRFLTHMQPSDAEAALHRISQMVAPGGFLVCTGVDVDVRTRVVRALGWTPVVDRIEALHEGDPTLLEGWPWEYWALEPLDTSRPDWQLRYATVFQHPPCVGDERADGNGAVATRAGRRPAGRRGVEVQP
jgi:chemotaxis methyl-accepting protein methylase